jgi:transcriptional regulator with XRE-family HTH domain
MTPSLPSSRKARRAALGAELRRLRQRSDVSEQAIAGALGTSQSAVSRIQSGDAPIGLPAVLEWARTVSATEEETDRLRWLLERAVTDVTPLRRVIEDAGGFAEGQRRIRTDFEMTSAAITNFQPFFVPGLLQTAAYARQVLATFRPAETLDSDVQARLDRQPILYDSSRRFEFVMTEAALRWHAGPADVLPPQLDQITSRAALAAVTIRIIPLSASWHTAPICAFNLYEERGDQEPMATVETLDDRTESEDVKPYRDELELLRRSALSGDEAIAFIRAMAR